jgi:pilus assembly protein CpaE
MGGSRSLAQVLILSIGGPATAGIRPLLEASSTTFTAVADAAAARQVVADHQLAVVDAASTAALIELCQAVRSAPGGQAVRLLAIAHGDDIEQRVTLLEAGADDVLVHPFDAREFEALVDALLLRAGPLAPATPAPGLDAPSAPVALGELYVFAAAKGGVGSTTLAVNCAVALAEMTHGLALVDLDLHHGQVATYLDVQSPMSTVELANEDLGSVDPQSLVQAAATHPAGVTVFAAPSRPELGGGIEPARLATMLDALRGTFAAVVVDAGSVLETQMVDLIVRAGRVVLTVTPDIPSLRVLSGALELLAESGVAADRLLFVLNNTQQRQMVTAEQIRQHLEVEVSVEVPYDGDAFLGAANEGQPLVLSAPNSAPAKAIRQLAALLLGASAETSPAAARRGRLGGLLKRG